MITTMKGLGPGRESIIHSHAVHILSILAGQSLLGDSRLLEYSAQIIFHSTKKDSKAVPQALGRFSVLERFYTKCFVYV